MASAMDQRRSDLEVEFLGACPLCGVAERTVTYEGLVDRLFGAPGEWTLYTCSRCGLLYLDPRPAPQALVKVYTPMYATRKQPPSPAGRGQAANLKARVRRGYLANTYGYSSGVSALDRVLGVALPIFAEWRDALDHIVLQLRAQPGGRLLDVGCGIGSFVETMSRLGWQAEGIDTDDQVVAICRARGLPVRVGLLEEQQYPDAYFDVVTMMHVIEHVSDPIGVLREVRRILRPRGRVLMLTPNINSLGHERFGANWLGLDAPRHFCIFNGATLAEAVQRAGFKRADWHSTTRISRFNGLVAHELRRYGRNAYFSTPPKASQKLAARFEREVRQRLRDEPEAGDELRLVAYA